MKCPKCDYLGFDTGARCKNCGYDFSLIGMAGDEPPRMTIDLPPDAPPEPRFWLDASPGAPHASPPPRTRTPLPLFAPPDEDDDDEPLIKLPAAPRPPLAVRKTPDSPRLRAIAKASPAPEPELQFVEEGPAIELELRSEPVAPPAPQAVTAPPRADEWPTGSAGPRLGAALIDHLILFGVDAAVVYFTLRMAGLTPAEWRVLPPAPLLAFLGLLKFGYFSAFTAVGGQTIGKMAVGLRVVSDSNRPIDGACAIRRTFAGIASLVLGLGFIPALIGSDRRTFHDRVAHTRVVSR